VGVCGAQQLTGTLGGGVWGDRPTDIVVFGEWAVRSGAVHGRRGAEEKTADVKFVAAFEEVEGSLDIDLAV
jgi:hypothetical protein